MTNLNKTCSEFSKFDKKDFKVVVEKQQLDMKLFSDAEKKFIEPAAHAKTLWKITWKKPKQGSLEEYSLNMMRTQIVRNRCRLPMKYLAPDKTYNNYACQKAPLNDIHTDVTQAPKVIEPLNIGFDDVIRTILIDQDIPIGSMFEINVRVPYESMTRMHFRSKSIKPIGKSTTSKMPFDPNLYIGTIDIGGCYRGKFTVQHVDMSLFDSYQMYQFEIIDNDQEQGIIIKTYDFTHVTAKKVIDEIIKLADVRTVPMLKIISELCK